MSSAKAELGATYIHGIDSNPIYQIAEQNNLLKLTQREFKNCSVLALTENGEELSSKVIQDVDWHYGLIMQECEEFFLHHKPTPVENDSVGEHMRREMSKYLSRYEGHDRKVREMVFIQRLLHEACLCGSDEGMADVSLGEIGKVITSFVNLYDRISICVPFAVKVNHFMKSGPPSISNTGLKTLKCFYTTAV